MSREKKKKKPKNVSKDRPAYLEPFHICHTVEHHQDLQVLLVHADQLACYTYEPAIPAQKTETHQLKHDKFDHAYLRRPIFEPSSKKLSSLIFHNKRSSLYRLNKEITIFTLPISKKEKKRNIFFTNPMKPVSIYHIQSYIITLALKLFT